MGEEFISSPKRKKNKDNGDEADTIAAKGKKAVGCYPICLRKRKHREEKSYESGYLFRMF